MTLRVWVTPFASGELDSSTFQGFRPTSNIAVRAIRTQIFAIDNPSFDYLEGKIYDNSGGAPNNLIATSTNQQLKSTVMTESHGVYDLYFEFSHVPLTENTEYYFVLEANIYTPTADAFLAWVHDFPDVWANDIDEFATWATGSQTAWTTTMAKAGLMPYRIAIISGDF